MICVAALIAGSSAITEADLKAIWRDEVAQELKNNPLNRLLKSLARSWCIWEKKLLKGRLIMRKKKEPPSDMNPQQLEEKERVLCIRQRRKSGTCPTPQSAADRPTRLQRNSRNPKLISKICKILQSMTCYGLFTDMGLFVQIGLEVAIFISFINRTPILYFKCCLADNKTNLLGKVIAILDGALCFMTEKARKRDISSHAIWNKQSACLSFEATCPDSLLMKGKTSRRNKRTTSKLRRNIYRRNRISSPRSPNPSGNILYNINKIIFYKILN